MKKLFTRITLTLFIMLSLCACVSTGTTEESSQGAFVYVHDPRLNAEAMEDIIVNPNAVYGFSPNPESTRLGLYAQYDWEDPEFVSQAREERKAYHESLQSMTEILDRMVDGGFTVEEIARVLSLERNRLRLAAYSADSKGLENVKKSNLAKYGHEDGPTPDELFAKYGSWEIVLQKAFSANLGMDACCGLFDEYYDQYIQLGYVLN